MEEFLKNGEKYEEVKCSLPQGTTEEKLKHYLSLYKTNAELESLINKNDWCVKLENKGLTDNEAYRIANWMYKNENVSSLFLENNEITSKGCTAIFEGLKGNSKLQKLNIKNEKGKGAIDDNAVKSLVELLKINKVLWDINLEGN